MVFKLFLDPKEVPPNKKISNLDSGVALETQDSVSVTKSSIRSEQVVSTEQVILIDAADKLAPKAQFDDSLIDVTADRANGIVGADNVKSSLSSAGNKTTGETKL